MLKNKRFLLLPLLAFLTCYTLSIQAQTDSPYSRYGFGKLRDYASGPSKGMGGVGYGLHTGQSANPMNPASYAQVDSLTFIFDLGVNYNSTSYKEGLNSATKNGGGLDYITALFPVSKKLGISFGILPFSSTGYKLGSTRTSVDEVTGEEVKYRVDHEGSGGLSQVYVGLGYKFPIKGLTAGVNVSYLFGKLNYANSITSVSQITSDPTYQNTTLNVTGAKIDLGIQYKIDLPEYSSFTIGAVYSPKMNNKGKLLRTEYQSSITGTTTLHNQMVPAGTPDIFGGGVAYSKGDNLLLAADATFENWEKVSFSDLHAADGLTSKERFNNRWRFAVGAEYRISSYSKNYLQKIKFRGGLNYSNSYVNVNTAEGAPKGYNEYGASLGFGLPLTDVYGLGRRTSYLNITFEYKYLKPEFKSMVSEKYFGVTLNVNMNQLWFMQRKIH